VPPSTLGPLPGSLVPEVAAGGVRMPPFQTPPPPPPPPRPPEPQPGVAPPPPAAPPAPAPRKSKLLPAKQDRY
jgi:hypothetical protein